MEWPRKDKILASDITIDENDLDDFEFGNDASEADTKENQSDDDYFSDGYTSDGSDYDYE